MSFKYKVLVLVLLAVVTRFIGLNWGNDFFFHPDESNMAVSLSQLSSTNLNPHFYAYGQFPLYLGYFTLKVFGIDNNYPNSIFILRLYSAVFSLISLYFFYKIYPNLLFILLLIFTPGLIQLAHFGTTESLLILTFSISLYLAKKIIDKPKFIYFFLASLCIGIATASKISGAIFAVPIIIAAIISRSWFLIPCGVLSILFAIVLSPYNLIEYSDFISALNYETSVATGAMPVFYTTQFKNSLPYIFQITRIFPFANAWPVLLFAIVSIFFIKIKNRKYVFTVIISCLVYFLYFGQLYVKWTRFMSPLFFVLPLMATLFLKRFPKFLPFALLPGLFFLSRYLFLDNRLVASRYLVSTLPEKSYVLSESGNVVNLPLLPNNLNIINYDFYNYDPISLANDLSISEYIIVPSRRVFKNYNYNYYRHLFDGSLGFQEIKRFTPVSDFFLNSENAEETWSVFDRPTIRVYKKVKNLSTEEYESIL